MISMDCGHQPRAQAAVPSSYILKSRVVAPFRPFGMTDSIRPAAPDPGAPTAQSNPRVSARPLSSRAPAPPGLAWEQVRSSGLSIRIKLIGLMVAMSLVIIVPLATYFPARELDELRSNRHDRAMAYADLASVQLRSVIAFSDRETAREVLGALAKDRSIDSVAVYSAAGEKLHFEGKPSELALRAGRLVVNQPTAYYLPGRVLALAPVKALEGARGTVVLELSTQSLAAMQRRLAFGALWVGGAALGLGVVLAWLISRSLARRIESIAEAASVMSAGKLDHQIAIHGPNDELGLLAHGFNAMSRKVNELVEHIQKTASQESARLERLVKQRTEQLHTKNKDLRLVLDNVEQGFVTIDRGARVVGEFSRVVETWLGPVSPDVSLWQLLDRAGGSVQAAFDAGWEQVVEDLLPVEATLDQMPRRLELGGRHLSFEYRPLGEQPFERLLLVITDISAVIAREVSEQEGRDLVNVTTRLVKDRADFLDFFSETERLLSSIVQNRGDQTALKRDLHTLKGNTAVYGLLRVAAVCHELESTLESEAKSPDCSKLLAAWEQTRAMVQRLAGEGERSSLQVSEAQYRGLLAAVQAGSSRVELAHTLRSWRLEPIRTRLERVAEQLTSTVARLGRGRALVQVTAADVLLSREELHEFWSVFSHVVRNAAVHGLNDEPSRPSRLGQPDFELRAGLDGERFFVQLSDTGPGVDWDKLRDKARALGVAHDSQTDLEEALFADGISTRSDVCEEAGRGVGLSAVRAACLHSHGSIKVTSKRGAGASFHFSWPAARIASLTLPLQQGAA
jgi:two-component system, chemotaxis family, sensor kinase CheA